MKKIITTALIIIQMNCFAQFNGKPNYEILVTQLGDTLGRINVELFPTIAPMHVANFDSIVNAPINYDNRAFHRIIPNFMIQGGDPNSISGPTSTWGQGNSNELNVNAEFNPISHLRGVISAARSTNINSASSQFFICQGNPTHLDNNYTAFGKVVSGINIVDTIVYKPRNSSDLPNNKISMFIKYLSTDSTKPSYAPQLNSPSDGAINLQSNSTFSWLKADSNDFLTYKLQFSKQSNFNVVDYQIDIDTSLSQTTISELEQGFQTYFWRVCSNNGGKLTCSSSRTLTTYISAPNRLTPIFEDINANTTQKFSWNKVENAEGYHLQVSKNSNFLISSQKVIDTIITDTLYLEDSLKLNSKYYWRINSIKNNVEGDFSDTWYFVVNHLLSFSEEIKSNLTAYPNPTKGVFYVEFEKKVQGDFYLYNNLGELLFSKKIDKKSEIEIDISNQSNGTYYYNINSSNKNKLSGKILLHN